VLGHRLALWVCALSVFSPINVFSAYFMPESMNFFFFYLFTWALFTGFGRRSIWMAVLTGAVLACMSMVKAHAVLLFGGVLVVHFSDWLSQRSMLTFKSSCLLVMVTAAAFCAVRFPVGYYLAGPASLNVLGHEYAGIANSTFGIAEVVRLLPLASYNFLGNLLAVAVIFGIPLAFVFDVNAPSKDGVVDGRVRAMKLYVIALMFGLIAVTAVFFAKIDGTPPYESVDRLSLRYYDFLFPMLLVAGLAGVKWANPLPTRFSRGLCVAVAILIAIAVFGWMKRYTPGIADCPELTAITNNPRVFTLIGLLVMVCLILAAMGRTKGAALYAWVVLPLTVAVSGHYIDRELGHRVYADAYDRAGQFAHHYLDKDTSRMLIVGSDISSVFRAQFYVSTQDTGQLSLPVGKPVSAAAVPPDKEWLLLIGDHAQPFFVERELQIPVFGEAPVAVPDFQGSHKASSMEVVKSFKLVKISPAQVVDLSRPLQGSGLASITGFSGTEQFGRWSEGGEVELAFAADLPPTFDLILTGQAFGPNKDLPFVLEIAGKTHEFRLGESLTDAHFQVRGAPGDRIMRIKIPKPISPRDLGLSGDTRKLGIALGKITIRQLRQPS
jgi:phosphoglycerol transferase